MEEGRKGGHFSPGDIEESGNGDCMASEAQGCFCLAIEGTGRGRGEMEIGGAWNSGDPKGIQGRRGQGYVQWGQEAWRGRDRVTHISKKQSRGFVCLW